MPNTAPSNSLYWYLIGFFADGRPSRRTYSSVTPITTDSDIAAIEAELRELHNVRQAVVISFSLMRRPARRSR